MQGGFYNRRVFFSGQNTQLCTASGTPDMPVSHAHIPRAQDTAVRKLIPHVRMINAVREQKRYRLSRKIFHDKISHGRLQICGSIAHTSAKIQSLPP